MKNKQGFLITFSGIDGSGKTTLSKKLVENLNKNGIKCKYVYGRLEPLVTKIFIWIGRNIFLKGRNPFMDYAQYSEIKREAIKHHTFMAKVYLSILIIEYLLQLLYKIEIPRMFGKNIVCDRYIYDTVVTDIIIDKNFQNFKIENFVKRLLYVAPRPDIAFLMDLPEEIALQRKIDIPSIEYLREKRSLYLTMGNEHKMVIIDGTRKLEELLTLILFTVMKII